MSARPGEPPVPQMRPAEAGDVTVLRDLELLLFGADAWSEEALHASVVSSVDRVLMLDEDGSLVAYGIVRVVGDVADLLRIGVQPESRRGGLGRRLLEILIETARSAGAKRMLLEVEERNRAARALYGNHGFAEIDQRPGYYRDGRGAAVLELHLSDLSRR